MHPPLGVLLSSAHQVAWVSPQFVVFHTFSDASKNIECAFYNIIHLCSSMRFIFKSSGRNTVLRQSGVFFFSCTLTKAVAHIENDQIEYYNECPIFRCQGFVF